MMSLPMAAVALMLATIQPAAFGASPSESLTAADTKTPTHPAENARLDAELKHAPVATGYASIALSSTCASRIAPSLPMAGSPARLRLGVLEGESVEDAMAMLGLRIDPYPEGKRIGHVYVVNQDVFSRQDWYFRFFNVFHRTTRSETLERELLMKVGQCYDEALVDESVRNLQTPPSLVTANTNVFSPPELSSVVAFLPVISPQPDSVDMLAVTRDLWSLRFNTTFEFQQGVLSLFKTSLSENNLFGWRKYLALVFDMDQGRYDVGPSYFDPNVAGSRLMLFTEAKVYYARDTNQHEGDGELFSLHYPLYALAVRWGAGFDFIHGNTVERTFHGNGLRVEDLSDTPDVVEAFPDIYRQRVYTTNAYVVRSFGHTVIQRVTFGHRFDRRHSTTLPDFPGGPSTPAEADAFLAEFAPLSETRSEPYFRYEMFVARYGTFRDLDTFDLRENRQVGPSVIVEAGASLPALGSDYQSFPVSVAATWAFAPTSDAYGYALGQASARLRSGRFIDQQVRAQVYLATPHLGRVARFVISAATDSVRADTRRTRFILGGSTGLRGYAIGDFADTSDFIAHLELRLKPLVLSSQRLGAIAFYDVGDAAPSFLSLVPHHDFGIGLRWLIPQLNSSVLRIDWAVATQSTTLTRAGMPGRITAGYLQVF
jgi:hypothetical protein